MSTNWIGGPMGERCLRPYITGGDVAQCWLDRHEGDCLEANVTARDRQMRSIRSAVVRGLTDQTIVGDDNDYDILARGSMAMAFRRLFPESPLEPRTDLTAPTDDEGLRGAQGGGEGA